MVLTSGLTRPSSFTWRDLPMAFSQSGIDNVRVVANGPDLFVAWSGTAPLGTTFQVYVDRRLAWSGLAQRCHVPTPSGAVGRNVWVEVGTVGANEPTQDYSASLVAPGGRTDRASLSWSGGTYMDPSGLDDVGGFLIYQSPAAGAPVDDLVAVDSVLAYPGGWINDGFGKGGFGSAGFGRAATFYEWQSGPLASGTWQFAVVPVDRAGNPRGGSLATSVAINAAPRPPALDAQGRRLTYASPGVSAGGITLQWLASPTT